MDRLHIYNANQENVSKPNFSARQCIARCFHVIILSFSAFWDVDRPYFLLIKTSRIILNI